MLAALPAGSTFQPLMTCYLTDDTDPDDVERGFKEGVFTGVKLYPANATTNSAAGVTDYRKVMRVLERMEKIGMPFLMHGEDVDPEVDIFDREAMFIERYLSKWVRQFPGLRFILEHLSSKDGVDFVKSAAPQVGGTITPYHMVLTRTDWLGWGLKPYMYCMPVIKTAQGPRGAAQGRDLGRGLLLPRHQFGAASRSPRSSRSTVFPACSTRRSRSRPTPRCSRRRARSTSSKPSPRSTGRSTTGCRRTRSASRWRRSSWTAPEEVKVEGPDERALVYRGGETIEWKVVD